MPVREFTFQNRSIYHVFNKTIENKKIFFGNPYCSIFLEIVKYYRSSNALISFSRLKDLKAALCQKLIEKTCIEASYQIHILAYCLMPTHFHMLIEQTADEGIQKSMGKILNSFTRYYNRKNHRIGPLFLPRFKAVQITSDSQLMHVSRYIHLNPYSSKIVKEKKSIMNYPYSSFSDYLNNRNSMCMHKEPILSLFSNKPSLYKSFVMQNADHQQMLEHAKHVYGWKSS